MEKYMETDLRYLKSLANQYPTVAAAATEIINLQAILSLPKGTEHFITDIHGEYDQFQHVIRNGSGAIKRKIEEEFGNAISAGEKKVIATLIYYPEQKLEQGINRPLLLLFIIRKRRWTGLRKRRRIWRTGIRSPCTG